ncbi:MAG: hypothetical protein ACQEVA_11805 [Myxococcota bacterium]
MERPWFIIVLLVFAVFASVGCDRDDHMNEDGRGQPSEEQQNPRHPIKKLEVEDSFEIGGFSYSIVSVERSDVHARFEDEISGEMEWVTIHYRLVNTSDKPMAPIIPDVLVETNGLKFRDTGGNAQIGEKAVQESGVSIGQLDEVDPGETELNMAIFKIPDAHVDQVRATFDFDGYDVRTQGPLEYQFELTPVPDTEVLAEPTADAGETEEADGGDSEANTDEPTDSGE